MEKDVTPQRTDEASTFTVFKSPPWCVPPGIRHVTFCEEFPLINGLGKRTKMNLSKSLESIPENSVWHGGKQSFAGGAKESPRIPAHNVLPPIKQIQQILDNELPEMRVRAFSDPNAYRASALRDKQQSMREAKPVDVQHKSFLEVPKSVPRPPMTPPLRKSRSPKMARKSTKRSPSDASSAEESAYSTDDTASANAKKDAVDNTTPIVGAFGAARRVQPVEIREKPITKKAGVADPRDRISSPGAAVASGKVLGDLNGAIDSRHLPLAGQKNDKEMPVAGNRAVAKNKMAASADGIQQCLTPPRLRRSYVVDDQNSQPKIMHPPNAEKNNRVHLSRYLKSPGEDSSTIAFALVGSPGRKRWPSPQRQRTSFIDRPTSSISNAPSTRSEPAPPSADSASDSSDNNDDEAERSRLRSNAIDIQARSCSKEFQTIMSGYFAGTSSMSSEFRPSERNRDDDSYPESRVQFFGTSL